MGGGALQQLRIRLYACGDAANGCIRPKDGVNARREQCGGGQSEVVMDSKQ